MAFFKRKAKEEKKPEQAVPINVGFPSRDDMIAAAASEFSSDDRQQIRKAVFLWWADGKSTKDCTYPVYMQTKYGISDASGYHKQLIKEGCLEPASFEDAIQSFKVDQLKEICTDKGIKATGKKADLIKGLSDALSDDDKKTVSAMKSIYVLSDKGKAITQEYSDFIELHKCPAYYSIDIDEFETARNELLKKGKGFSFNDICWGIFNKRTIEYSTSRSYGLMRNNYYNMARLLMGENRQASALGFLLTVLLYDISEAVNDPYTDTFTIAPGLADDIEKLKEFYSDDMIDNCYKYFAGYKLIPKEQFISMINK